MDWAYSYKVLLLLTALFHPVGNIRKYAFYLSVTFFIFGNINLYISDGYLWFIVAVIRELTCIVLTILVVNHVGIKTVIILQGGVFTTLNIHQMLGWYDGSLFYNSFLLPQEYIYWSKWGFELLMVVLWLNEDVFKALRQRWTFNNVTMCYILLCIAYFAGNY